MRTAPPYPTSCYSGKDTFGLRETALWGLHALFSWEVLWHNSCSVNPSSAQFSGSLSQFFLWGEGHAFDFFILICSCIVAYMYVVMGKVQSVIWVTKTKIKYKDGKQKTHGEKVQTPMSYVRVWQEAVCLTKVWSILTCHNDKPVPAFHSMLTFFSFSKSNKTTWQEKKLK